MVEGSAEVSVVDATQENTLAKRTIAGMTWPQKTVLHYGSGIGNTLRISNVNNNSLKFYDGIYDNYEIWYLYQSFGNVDFVEPEGYGTIDTTYYADVGSRTVTTYSGGTTGNGFQTYMNALTTNGVNDGWDVNAAGTNAYTNMVDSAIAIEFYSTGATASYAKWTPPSNIGKVVIRIGSLNFGQSSNNVLDVYLKKNGTTIQTNEITYPSTTGDTDFEDIEFSMADNNGTNYTIEVHEYNTTIQFSYILVQTK
jgi:hypothetical protein